MSICRKCGSDREFYLYNNSACKRCLIKTASDWHKNNPEAAKATVKRFAKNHPHYYRDMHYRRNRGISRRQAEEMLAAQDHKCANQGCREPLMFVPKKANTAHLDHDHKTGKNRGFLCAACNTSLGFLKDDPIRIAGLANYLSQAQPPSAQSPPPRIPE